MVLFEFRELEKADLSQIGHYQGNLTMNLFEFRELEKADLSQIGRL